jgi:hypothetical protein
MERFSKRFGHSLIEKEIAIREDAPVGLRQFIIQVLFDLDCEPKFVREMVCSVLRVTPDTMHNWGDENIKNEVYELLDSCDWYYIYDIIEKFHKGITQKKEFAEEVNDYFKANGIGWKLEGGQITFRGDESFERDLRKAEAVLAEGNLNTAKNEMREAVNDLSRRPIPDITGSIQHAVACLECVAREVTGNQSQTLGDVIKRNRHIVPVTIDTVIEKIRGFSSEQGRHLKENGEPSYEEAELMVGLSASISTYLARKSQFLKSKPASSTDF